MKLTKQDLEVNELSRKVALVNSMNSHLVYGDKASNKDLIVIVNMREPSYRKRLYVYDLKTNKFVANHHTTHGEKSCGADRAYAAYFSNTPNSHATSLGAMVTEDTYTGKHGRSLRLKGLEKGINNNVKNRYIVIHSADYCTNGYILAAGRAGCSHGCFAVDPAIAKGLIDLIKGGTFLYCHY